MWLKFFGSPFLPLFLFFTSVNGSPFKYGFTTLLIFCGRSCLVSKDPTVQQLENSLQKLSGQRNPSRHQYASTGGENQKRQRQQIVDGLAKIKLRF